MFCPSNRIKDKPNMDATRPWSKKLKILTINWSQSISFQCIPKITKDKTSFAVKFLWSFVFLVFTALTSLILTRNILVYFEYNFVSTISVVNESPTLFLTVTICDSSMFKSKYAENFLNSFMLEMYGSTDYMTYPEVITQIQLITNFAKLHVNSPNYTEENRKKLGFNMSEIISTCTFNGMDCDRNNVLSWYFHFNYGNCFQFNSGYNSGYTKRYLFRRSRIRAFTHFGSSSRSKYEISRSVFEGS